MKGRLFPSDLYRALAEQQEIEVVDLDTSPPDPILARRVPETLARRIMAIPVGEINNSTYTESASNQAVLDAEEDAASGQVEDLSSITELHDDGPIVRFIDLLLRRAVDPAYKRRCLDSAPTPQELSAAGWTDALLADSGVARPGWRQSVGCTECNGNDYKGRLGVHQVMLLSPNVQQHTLARASTAIVKQQAIQEGMLTMRQGGSPGQNDADRTRESTGLTDRHRRRNGGVWVLAPTATKQQHDERQEQQRRQTFADRRPSSFEQIDWLRLRHVDLARSRLCCRSSICSRGI
jgi:hypothetical protein